MTPEYPGSVPKCLDPGSGTSKAVTVGAATLLAKGLESLGRSTGAIRTSTELNHVVCVFYLSGTLGVRVVISAVGDREIGSAGEPGEVAGSVPGCSELLGRRLGVKRSEWDRGPSWVPPDGIQCGVGWR